MQCIYTYIVELVDSRLCDSSNNIMDILFFYYLYMCKSLSDVKRNSHNKNVYLNIID